MPASASTDVRPPPLRSELSVNDLAAVGDDLFAVGMKGAPAPARVAHTKGGTPWLVVAYSSSDGAVHTQLAGVHAIAGDDVWAVGWRGLFQSHTEHTHITHGDGASWHPVESPDFGDGSHLSGVAAWGPDDALAVGARSSHSLPAGGPVGLSPVALWEALGVLWDGARWSAVPGPGRGTLHDVCAVGPGSYWAVGSRVHPERAGNVPLVALYTGGAWQQVGAAGVGPLFDVAATGPDDVWAVGQDQDPGHAGGALVLHHDGRDWEQVETGVTGQAWLSGVACARRDDVWAVGTRQREDGAFGPLILHFDGTAWAAVEPPATAAPQGLSAVAALPGGGAWAAGGFSATGETGFTILPAATTPGGP
ncbi:hypothetical protein GCM10023168_26490 [Fodinibacter luteus]|uniref:Uncharacterized protein n=1 Tax=Fodinibacter luteus TaxID=552064 RepID=A0ABP8KLI9_9MICO